MKAANVANQKTGLWILRKPQNPAGRPGLIWMGSGGSSDAPQLWPKSVRRFGQAQNGGKPGRRHIRAGRERVLAGQFALRMHRRRRFGV